MIGIDTNILVRYLTNDDLGQCKKISEFFAKYKNTPRSIFINNIVICETVWVLDRGYKYSKEIIVNTLKLICRTPEFAFENHNLIMQSIIEYENNNAIDLSDIIISIFNKNIGCRATVSFDKKAVDKGLFIEI